MADLSRLFFGNLNDVRQRVAAQDYETDRRLLSNRRLTMKDYLKKKK